MYIRSDKVTYHGTIRCRKHTGDPRYVEAEETHDFTSQL